MRNDEIQNTTEETNTCSSDTKRIALITGITGQDGSYLTELLLSKGYMVHGIIRRSSTLNTSRIDKILLNHNSNSIKIHYGDLTDSLNLNNLINDINPDEVYNLGALSHVKVSFDLPETTGNINALGTLRLLEAIKNNTNKEIKFYQASTSELFGKVQEVPQNESTPFYPRSPYGVAKIYAYWTTVNYREAYGMFAANGILFNHESPRRGHNFVTRKITRSVAQIYLNKQEFITLGNLDSKRDWGHAKDYVEAMWLMLQKDKPEDFVISTNETHTIREFVETAFREINKEIIWKGSGENEIGLEKDTGKIRIKIDPKFYRPTEVHILLGDSSKAEEKLNWKRKISFKDLVKEMVESDIKLMKDSSSYHDFE